jgi:hypothetical protein
MDLSRLRHLSDWHNRTTRGSGAFTAHDIVAKLDTIQANAAMNTKNELLYLLAAFAAQHAPTIVPVVPAEPSHLLPSRAI